MCVICDGSFDSNELIYLDCSNCDKVTSLPADLPNLKFLSIYKTNIEFVPPYQSLESLYCFETPIKTLPSLPKLRKLFAQDSELDMIPEDYFRVEVINVNNTPIISIPDTLISLRWLAANETSIESISSKLISMEWLSMENSNVDSMPKEMLSLQYLNCSGTKVCKINTRGYPMLRKLSCRGCAIDPFSFSNGLDVSM